MHKRAFRCGVLLSALILAPDARTITAAAKPPSRSDSRPVVQLRIGVVCFDRPAGAGDRSATENSLREYFNEVEAAFRSEPIDVRIVPVPGNYYQIVHWMRAGLLDGAVVSSFSAYLLTHDAHLAVLPVASFSRGPTRAVIIAARNDKPVARPVNAAVTCLMSAWKSIADPGEKQLCEFRFINHLSTTGFVLPVSFIGKELTEMGVPPHEQTLVWTRILQWSRFALEHQTPRENAPDKTTITFSYSGPNTPLPGTAPLPVGSLPSLDDTLLLGCVRRAESSPPQTDAERLRSVQQECRQEGVFVPQLFQPSSTDNSGTPDPRSPWMAPAGAVENSRISNGYRHLTAWSENDRQAFSRIVRDTFQANRSLEKLYVRWYIQEQYAFTVDELIDILHTDQDIREAQQAVLVLPGGGVRATYQAAMLDDLYSPRKGSRGIANLGNATNPTQTECVDTVDATDPALQNKLIIRGIAGTSGGALLGYFASKRGTKASTMLTDLWIKKGKVQTKPLDVFPSFGALRWLSLVLLLAVFAGSASVHLPHQRKAPPDEVPFWYTTFLTLVVVAAPFLIWLNLRQDPAYRPVVEGFAFLGVILIAHFVHSVSRSGKAPRTPVWLAVGVLLLLAGGGAISIILQHRKAIVAATRTLSGTVGPLAVSVAWSMLSFVTVLLFISGLYAIAAANGVREDTHLMKSYAWSMVVLLSTVVLGTTGFVIGMKCGEVTPLEMTLDYWMWVFVCSVLAAKVVVTAVRLFPGSPLQPGVDLLTSPAGTSPFPYTPAISLIAWSVLGLAAWLVFISPALYTSMTGRNAFDDAVAQHEKLPHLVPLVVSMTGLGENPPGYKPYWGDRYAVLPGWCGILASDQMKEKVFPLSEDRHGEFLNAVFASGSPFPIYPSTPVKLEDLPGLFVDGGFAHRVPLEAARLLQAQQILVVENVSRAEPLNASNARGSGVTSSVAPHAAKREDVPSQDASDRPTGSLVTYMGSVFNFLFQRAQAFDVQSARSAVVATIYPDWSPPDPFLMDFRSTTVKALLKEEQDDVRKGHRIGRIESWGEPLELHRRTE